MDNLVEREGWMDGAAKSHIYAFLLPGYDEAVIEAMIEARAHESLSIPLLAPPPSSEGTNKVWMNLLVQHSSGLPHSFHAFQDTSSFLDQ